MITLNTQPTAGRTFLAGMPIVFSGSTDQEGCDAFRMALTVQKNGSSDHERRYEFKIPLRGKKMEVNLASIIMHQLRDFEPTQLAGARDYAKVTVSISEIMIGADAAITTQFNAIAGKRLDAFSFTSYAAMNEEATMGFYTLRAWRQIHGKQVDYVTCLNPVFNETPLQVSAEVTDMLGNVSVIDAFLIPADGRLRTFEIGFVKHAPAAQRIVYYIGSKATSVTCERKPHSRSLRTFLYVDADTGCPETFVATGKGEHGREYSRNADASRISAYSTPTARLMAPEVQYTPLQKCSSGWVDPRELNGAAGLLGSTDTYFWDNGRWVQAIISTGTASWMDMQVGHDFEIEYKLCYRYR